MRPSVDPLQVLGLVLLSLFVLSLFTGSRSGLLAVGVLAALLAVFAGIGYLIFAGFSPAVAAAVVAAGAALVIMMRLGSGRKKEPQKEEKEPLFDIRLVDKKCVPLEDGIKTLPPDVAAAITDVIGEPGRVYKLCAEVYEGRDVPGGRAEVLAITMLFAPGMIAMELLRALKKLGLDATAEPRELGWIVRFNPPTKAEQHI